jgi:hypothetical protein
MFDSQAAEFVQSKILLLREDVARAKNWLLGKPGGGTDELAVQWLSSHQLCEPAEIDGTSSEVEEALKSLARAISLRLSFYQAVAELVGEGVMIAAYYPKRWDAAVVYRSRGYRGALTFRGIGCSYPERIERSPFGSDAILDVDVFLQGIDCTSLHSGIVEAIEQALGCLRRGLYMPSIAMLAAGAEATWHECTEAVAKNQGVSKLTTMANDPHTGIGILVGETIKALSHGNAKPLLQSAGVSINHVRDAELWTTTLRDRRNALHWGRAKSFIANHSDTSTLLLAAPMHFKTLEAIRLAC